MRLKVKILKPFMFNGKMLQVGDEVEMDADRAVRHMKYKDVERNEKAIQDYKDKMIAKSQATIKAMGNF